MIKPLAASTNRALLARKLAADLGPRAATGRWPVAASTSDTGVRRRVDDGRVSSAAANGASAVVAMRGLRKRFGDLQALAGVDFDLRAGEIHALIGENGAGKTTLMNVLYGVVSRDAGTIEANGKQVDVRTPRYAIELGIGMVHQHFKLVSTLSVVENVVLGQGGHVLIRKCRLAAVAERISELANGTGCVSTREPRSRHLSVGATATRRNPPGAVSRRAGADPRRADREPPRRARPTVCWRSSR